MRRKYNWQSLLMAYIDIHREADFVWGTSDCGLFIAGAVNVMTGIDPAEKLRGKYKTPRGAIGAMKRYSGGGITETLTKALGDKGFIPVEINYAQRGDVVTLPIDGDYAAGICVGVSAVFMNVDGGVAHVPMSQCVKAWRI